jgi:hypothetical protein
MQKKVEESPPIFVVGPPRSGTTLTAKILGRHSRVFVPGETHFFDDIYARRRELGELSDPAARAKVLSRLDTIYERYDEAADQRRIHRIFQSTDLREQLGRCLTYKDLLSHFMESQMRSAGKIRWGNNVPKDIFHVKEILSFYPGAKFIVCLRDVRDFLLSYKYKWRNTGKENSDRVKKLYHPVVTSLLWKASVKQILRAKDAIPSGNVTLVRYERLAEKPEQSIRELCDFIGEDFEPAMGDVNEGNSSFEVTKKGIYSSSISRWRRLLSAEEACVAQSITKDLLQELGYSLERLKVNPIAIGYIWATTPYGLCRAVHANRAIRGPLLPYLTRRIAAALR